MKEYIICNKQENSSQPVSTNDIIRVFETSNDINLLKSLVEKAEERIYLSWASVEGKDKAGESIPIDKDFIEKERVFIEERGGPINDEHTNANVGKTLAFKVLEHPKTKTQGILHLNKIYNHNDRDDQVWKDIVSGKKKGSSVGGIADTTRNYERDEQGDFVRQISNFAHFETSAVENPCNPFALNESFSMVAKSHITKEDENINKEVKNTMKNKTEVKTKAEVLGTILSKVSPEDVLNEEEQKILEAIIEDIKGKEEKAEEPAEEEKEDEMDDESKEDDKMSEMEDIMESVISRLDKLEESMSGKSSDEEEKADTDEDEEEKADEEETEKSELEKKVEELTKANQELKKKFEVKKSIKTERPNAEVKKSELTAVDVALGKAKYVNGQIIAR